MRDFWRILGWFILCGEVLGQEVLPVTLWAIAAGSQSGAGRAYRGEVAGDGGA
jgi:hypothetical protein